MNILVIGHFDANPPVKVRIGEKLITLNKKTIENISNETNGLVNVIYFLMPEDHPDSSFLYEKNNPSPYFQFKTVEELNDFMPGMVFDRVYLFGGDPYLTHGGGLIENPSVQTVVLNKLSNPIDLSRLVKTRPGADKIIDLKPPQSAGYKRRSYKSSKSKKRRNNTRRYKKKSSKRRSGKRV